MNCWHNHIIINEKHEYIINLPSVSQIVNFLLGNSYEGIDKKILKKAADIGNLIHETIHNYIVEGLEFDIKSLNEIASKALNGFIELCEQKQISDYELFSEIPLVSELFVGTPDLIYEKDKKTHIIDFKTTAQTHLEDWTIQLHLYAMLTKKEEFDLEIWHFIKKTNKWEVIKIEYSPELTKKLWEDVKNYHKYY